MRCEKLETIAYYSALTAHKIGNFILDTVLGEAEDFEPANTHPLEVGVTSRVGERQVRHG